MSTKTIGICFLGVLGLLAQYATHAVAQDSVRIDPPRDAVANNREPSVRLWAAPQEDSGAPGGTTEEPMSIESTQTIESDIFTSRGYREVSDIFNIREANPQVDKGEWEIEMDGRWQTFSNGQDDNFGLAQTIKYGITDDLFIELEVLEPNLGDGADQGNGDMELIVFNRFVRETDTLPAIAGVAEMRIPSGDGSSGVDGLFSAILTKTIVDRFRVHLQGFVMTANGDIGSDSGSKRYKIFPTPIPCHFDVIPVEEKPDRRHFQWGVGPGFDYLVDEKTIALLNYLHRSSEYYGNHNQNILELGAVREIARTADTHQHVKLALDIGLDGAGETPNFGVKLQWSLDWK